LSVTKRLINSRTSEVTYLGVLAVLKNNEMKHIIKGKVRYRNIFGSECGYGNLKWRRNGVEVEKNGKT